MSRAAIPTSITDLGLIWMQGEQDASDAGASVTNTFATNTANMLAEFRTRISQATMPAIVCRLNADIDRDATQLANVRLAQGTQAGGLNDTASYPYNVFFDTDSYALVDTVHFEQYQYGEDLYNVLF